MTIYLARMTAVHLSRVLATRPVRFSVVAALLAVCALPLATTESVVASVRILDPDAYVSSCVTGMSCPNGTTTALTDSDPSTYWVSALCTAAGGACNESIEVRVTGGAVSVDYVRLIPHIYDTDGNQVVPHEVQLYYWSSGWNLILSTTLPERLPQSGMMLHFTAVTTGRILVASGHQRSDIHGGSYMEMAEVAVGLSTVESKTLYYEADGTPSASSVGGGFSCKVFGDSTYNVLINDEKHLAYDFNVTEVESLYASPTYVGVFHAEPAVDADKIIGDSSAVLYQVGPDGLFGYRDCLDTVNDDDCDILVTRTSNQSKYAYAGSILTGPEAGPLSVGGNPILLKRNDGNGLWALFYVVATDLGEMANAWHHYLMLGYTYNSYILQMHDAPWVALAGGNGGNPLTPANDYYAYFGSFPSTPDGALSRQLNDTLRSFEPVPVRNWENEAITGRVKSILGPASVPAGQYFERPFTQGLIGNMSYGSNLSEPVYYFSIDDDSGEDPVGGTYLRRTRSADPHELNLWEPAVRVLNKYATKVAFYPDRNLWMIAGACLDDNEYVDLCMQFTNAAPSFENWSGIEVWNQHARLGLPQWFRGLPTARGIMSQFGILKNPYGQVPGNDFRFYVTDLSIGGAAQGLYGMDVSSVRVTCTPGGS